MENEESGSRKVAASSLPARAIQPFSGSFAFAVPHASSIVAYSSTIRLWKSTPSAAMSWRVPLTPQNGTSCPGRPGSTRVCW
jgi:hypothetical protein